MKKGLFILFLSLFCITVYCQTESLFSLTLTPGIELPLIEERKYFALGGKADVEFNYRLPFFPILSIYTGIGYSYLPIWSGDGCNFLIAGGGPGINLPKMGKFSALLYGSTGYYYGIIADSEMKNGGNLYVSGGLQIGYALTPAFDLGLNAKYKVLFDGNGGTLFNGVNVGLSTTFRFLQSRQLRMEDIQFINIFPVLYKYYDNNKIGSVKITNTGSAPVDDLEVSFFVANYMDNPTLCPSPRVLGGGQEILVDLYALFAESVLNITEATVVSGKIVATYTQNKKKATTERAASLRLYDRNALTWDDDRKVAAYVTYKDPVIIDLAKSIARVVSESGSPLDSNLAMGIALHEALRGYGLAYVKDPTTPFTEFSRNKLSVDYIQFPRNTLQFKSGDCDDLSILYTAMLEAVGIDTAFITSYNYKMVRKNLC